MAINAITSTDFIPIKNMYLFLLLLLLLLPTIINIIIFFFYYYFFSSEKEKHGITLLDKLFTVFSLRISAELGIAMVSSVMH